MQSISFHLRPAPPFRLDLTVWALRRMPHNRIDRWDGTAYERVLVLDDRLVRLRVTQPGSAILVHAEAHGHATGREELVPVIERLLGVRIDLAAFQRFAARTPFARLAADFNGFKPPRFPSLYEGVINAIACQQISLHVCIELLNRLCAARGRTWSSGTAQLAAFPEAADLAAAAVLDLRSLGFSGSKARAIIAVSREAASGGMDLASLAGKTDTEVVQALTALPGIGPWSAEYVMLRGLGRTHIFPGGDSGALRSLQSLLKLRKPPDAARFATLVRGWHPFAGLVYFHFLLNKLRSRGVLGETELFAPPASAML